MCVVQFYVSAMSHSILLLASYSNLCLYFSSMLTIHPEIHAVQNCHHVIQPHVQPLLYPALNSQDTMCSILAKVNSKGHFKFCKFGDKN